MAEEGAAQALLEAMLPRAFLRRVVGAPQRLPEHFVDERLRVGVADQLLRWQLHDGRNAYVYCLVEHKRTRERFGLVQLLQYQALLYPRLRKEARSGRLPTVVTLLVFNGTTRWRGPTRFIELTRPPRELRRFALDFGVLLLDLGATRVERLTSHPTLRGGLLALKSATAAPRAQQRLVREAIRLLREDPSTLTTFLSYLQEVVGEEALPLVERAAELEEGDAAMRSINQYFEELGRRKGLRAGMKRGLDRGIVRGREDALRSAVTKVLARRFKKLPPSVTQKLAEADVATLEQWLDAALDARSLRAVFH